MSKDMGGAAFPKHPRGDDGMTLRDYFAAKAMQAAFAKEGGTCVGDAKCAYAMADAMLAERAK